MESLPANAAAAAAPLTELDRRTKFEILGAVMLGLLLGALDQTIVSVALPTIVTDLGGQSLLTWTITIYLLTSTITVPFYGKLSDLYGRKPLLMIGITLFLIGSALSGLSGDMTQLIVFRGIQGLGAGALFPISLAIIGDLFTPAERGKYQGLFGAVFGLSSIVGPLLGGWITENASWHWIFYVNLPVGAIALFVIWRLLPTIKRPDATRNLDFLGAWIFAVAVTSLLVGLTNKQTGDWADPEVGGLVAISAALSLVFLAVEAQAREPIVPLGLWRERTYSSSIVATFLISFGFFGAIVFLPQWFQFVRGISPTESGLQTLALLAGLIFGSIVAGQIVSRTGRYKLLILASTGVMAVGLLLLTNLRPDTPLPVIWLWMFITGLGIGPTFSVFTIVIQNAVPVRDLGVATSNLTFFRQIGGSIGLAVVGTVFGARLTQAIPEELERAGVPPQFSDAFVATGSQGTDLVVVGQDLGQAILAQVPAGIRPMVEPLIPNIIAGIQQAFSLAISDVFLIGAATTGLALLVGLAMRELPLRTGASAQLARPTHDGGSSRTRSAVASPAPD